MTKTMVPLWLILLIAGLSPPAAGFKPRFHASESHQPAAAARITEAPSQAALHRKLRRAGDPLERRVELSVDPCATACINAAVTKSTSCKVGDWSCECSETNQGFIEAGALSCVYQRCGYAIGANVFSEAADFCLSFNNGEFSTDAATATPSPSPTTTGASDSTTSLAGTKSTPAASISFSVPGVSAPTGNSGGSGVGTSSSSSSSATTTSAHGLSTAATAGIAVGAAAGGIILCVAAFFIWRSCRGRQKRTPITYSAVSHSGDDAAAAYPPPPGGRAEVDGTPTLVYNTSSPSPVPGRDDLGKLPSVTSSPSPASVPPVSEGRNETSLPGADQQQMSDLRSNGRHVTVANNQAWPQHTYSEVEGTRPPEMQGDTYITQELHGQYVVPELYGEPYASRNQGHS